jgi:hypothetical protein
VTKVWTRPTCWYAREKPCFYLELSLIQFVNYSLHFVNIFYFLSWYFHTNYIISNTHKHTLLQYYVTRLDLIIACVYRHLTVFWLPLLYLDTCRSVHWSQRYVTNYWILLLISHQYKRYLVSYYCSLTCLLPMRREQHGSGGDCQIKLFPASSALACNPRRWEQQKSGGTCQTNFLPASSALSSQPVRHGQ